MNAPTTPDERGSATLELVVWAPVLLLLIGLLGLAGRINSAHGAVEQAAVDAARRASIARTPEAARSRALASAAESLAHQGIACTSLTVTVDTSGFAAQPGTPATVTATVSCPVRLSDLSLPLPGTRTVTHTAVSSLDTFRERA